MTNRLRELVRYGAVDPGTLATGHLGVFAVGDVEWTRISMHLPARSFHTLTISSSTGTLLAFPRPACRIHTMTWSRASMKSEGS